LASNGDAFVNVALRALRFESIPRTSGVP
jgi:hypothetical protein